MLKCNRLTYSYQNVPGYNIIALKCNRLALFVLGYSALQTKATAAPVPGGFQETALNPKPLPKPGGFQETALGSHQRRAQQLRLQRGALAPGVLGAEGFFFCWWFRGAVGFSGFLGIV